MTNECIARDYFKTICDRNSFTSSERDITFKYRDHRGNHFADTSEKVCLCDFHYNWLKTIESLEMRGENPEYATDDLLENFKRYDIFRVWNRRYVNAHYSDKGTMYLLRGDHEDSIPVFDDYNYNWTLNGIFTCTNPTNYIFEILPITDKSVMEWVQNQEFLYDYPVGSYTAFFSKETGIEIEQHELYTINGGCYTRMVEDTHIYTNIEREFNMVIVEKKIHEFYWNKINRMKMYDFNECLDFMKSEMDNDIFGLSDLYSSCKIPDETIYQGVILLKEALLHKNTKTINTLKCRFKDSLHIIMWVIYVSTNHKFYQNDGFGKIPNIDTNRIEYFNFYKNLVELFIEESLVSRLLCLAISGDRQRIVCHKQSHYHNVVCENKHVVKLIVPAYINANTDIIHDNKTAQEYWNTYDNTLFNARAIEPYHHNTEEKFDKNNEIGEFLKMN